MGRQVGVGFHIETKFSQCLLHRGDKLTFVSLYVMTATLPSTAESNIQSASLYLQSELLTAFVKAPAVLPLKLESQFSPQYQHFPAFKPHLGGVFP